MGGKHLMIFLIPFDFHDLLLRVIAFPISNRHIHISYHFDSCRFVKHDKLVFSIYWMLVPLKYLKYATIDTCPGPSSLHA